MTRCRLPIIAAALAVGTIVTTAHAMTPTVGLWPDTDDAWSTTRATAITTEGVTLEGDRPDRVTGWDRVRTLEGLEPAEADRYMAIARAAWRARTRLERGDAAGAEPLLESLLPMYQPLGGPTAAVVKEGLLRCRLARSATASSASVWLDWLAGDPWRPSRGLASAYDGLEPIADRATGLVPALPPVFVASPPAAVAAWASPPPTARPEANDRAAALATLYRLAGQLDAELIEADAAAREIRAAGLNRIDDDAVALCLDILLARCGDADARREARSALESRARRARSGRDPAWIESWCRLAIGRSLTLETDPESVRLGVLELLHVPVRLESETPGLAGTALGLAAEACARIGDPDAAAALIEELQTAYPDHPVTAWPPLRALLDRTLINPAGPTGPNTEEPA